MRFLTDHGKIMQIWTQDCKSPSNSAVASANDNAPGLETIVLSNPRLLAESLPPLSSMCRSEDSRAYIR